MEEFVCERCNMVRTATVTWSTGAPTNPTGVGTLTKEQAAEIMKKLAPPKPPVGWICFYCGVEFDSEDVLLDHEDDCAEA